MKHDRIVNTIFNFSLRFGEVDKEFYVPFRRPEEMPKQKHLHFVTDYALWAIPETTRNVRESQAQFDSTQLVE